MRRTKRPRGTGRIFQQQNNSALSIAYCHRGKEIRESVDKYLHSKGIRRQATEKDAEKLLKRRFQEIGADALGLKTFIAPRQDRLTVKDILDALESDFRLRGLKSLRQTLGHMNMVRNLLGDLRAVDVSDQTVTRYIEKRLAEKRAPATINRETTMLGEAFRLAVRRRQLSSMPTIPKLRENNTRRGFFESADFEAVVAALPDYLRGFVRFAFLCGWRKSEIASLQWADVDLPGKMIRLPDSKNGHGRALTLEGELGRIVERQWKVREISLSDGTVSISQYVFHRTGKRIRDFRKAWAKACEAANVPCGRKVPGGKTFHDFRRTGARNLVRSGVPERVAMEITGHKTRSIFDRYNIVSEDDLREAVQKVEAYLSGQPSDPAVLQFAESKIKTRR